MTLLGTSIIGFGRGDARGRSFHGINPSSRESLLPVYFSASDDEVNRACRIAGEASSSYGNTGGRERAAFLRRIAVRLESLADEVVLRAEQETGLPEARLRSETGRTCGQLKMFADLVEEGSWVDARIDRADANRKPVPKPDVRSMLRPLGPVAVFCASNFPLAFSVAGGDTASALAGGNPVVVNAHYAHPGTSEIVGSAINDAARESNMPEGVFSLLYGADYSVGQTIVRHPNIKAVGFTGSRRGGLALVEIAAARHVPIPVFAEMSSVNPVFVLPGAVKQRWESIAEGLYASVTLGSGQFCTNPGLVVLDRTPPADALLDKLSILMEGNQPYTMLTSGIQNAYLDSVQRRSNVKNVHKRMAASPADTEPRIHSALFETDAPTFLSNSGLGDEVFGPSTTVVRHTNKNERNEIAMSMEGQLTATIHGTEEDLLACADLISILRTKVGRIIFNGYPTGVEVCHAMVHGGPYPSTSDGRSTSVGTRAILRFSRPFCYQGFPDGALPEELKNSNSLGVLRMVDGRLTREHVA